MHYVKSFTWFQMISIRLFSFTSFDAWFYTTLFIMQIIIILARWYNQNVLINIILIKSPNLYYLKDLDDDKNITATYALNQRNIPVTMEAKLDASYGQSNFEQSTDEHHRLFEWVRLSEIKAERKLQCTVTSLQPGELWCTKVDLALEKSLVFVLNIF